MSRRKKIIVITAVVVIIATLATIGIIAARSDTTSYVYLNGTVTDYDVTPTYNDGNIFFKIDGKSIDVGGGLRPSGIYGDFDQSIELGDTVSAKLIETDYGSLTIYDCANCYVRKQ